MRLAVISDIHSNLEALHTVWADIEKQNVDKTYCAGDLVGYGPFPNEVIDLVRSSEIQSVMGNYDDAIGHMRFMCGCDYKDDRAMALGEASITWTKEHTEEKNKEFLRSLPKEIRFRAGDLDVLLVHGSPNRLNEYILPELPLEQMKAYIHEGKADILICGHTHQPFHRVIQGKHLVNAGSVGKPKHGDHQAAYVIITIGEEVRVDIRKVQYDFEVTARAIREAGLPEEFAEQLRCGTV